MFVQKKYFTVKAGSSYEVIEYFVRKKNEGPSKMEQQRGFLSREIFVKKVDAKQEEVIVLIYWVSEAQWKLYEESLPSNDRLQREQANFAKWENVFECSYTHFQVVEGA